MRHCVVPQAQISNLVGSELPAGCIYDFYLRTVHLQLKFSPRFCEIILRRQNKCFSPIGIINLLMILIWNIKLLFFVL